MKRPNVIFVFADQLRYQATGFGGDPNVRTPHLDRLASQSLNFATAVSGCPVCSPARASLLTGQYPHKHGVFVNDVCLCNGAVSLTQTFKAVGYDTAYIGKWHLDGHGRSNYIPPERRQGFEFWKALECTHQYHRSYYYAGNDARKRLWDGYDAIAQTREAQRYIREHAARGPFLLMLSWGPPHNPYDTAPEPYRRRYDPTELTLRPNVPPEAEAQARTELAGYYAHVNALDDLVGDLLDTVRETGIEAHTVFVFWSDHGDMLGSQGEWRKQRPWDESLLVPLLIRYPDLFGSGGHRIEAPINTPDLMPTLLSLCGIPIPQSRRNGAYGERETPQPHRRLGGGKKGGSASSAFSDIPRSTVDGTDYAPFLKGERSAPADAVLIACYHPFGEYQRRRNGGREYRGVRTGRYTYVRDLSGPWLLYDNVRDPFQQNNLIGHKACADIQAHLDAALDDLLHKFEDDFLPGDVYIERWGYVTDDTGTVPYTT